MVTKPCDEETNARKLAAKKQMNTGQRTTWEAYQEAIDNRTIQNQGEDVAAPLNSSNDNTLSDRCDDISALDVTERGIEEGNCVNG